MTIEPLFSEPEFQPRIKKKKDPQAPPREKSIGKYQDREEYKPPVYIGQNIYIKPTYVVSIPEFHSENKSLSVESIENQKNLLDNKRNGKLSRKAVQGLRNSINWLCLAAKKKYVYDKKADKTFNFKVNFITLTLPDTKEPIQSADLQKKLLNPFLTYMRKYHSLANYVWRLEFQANGKLHVHLTTDTFLHLGIIRNTWNGLLDKHGYLSEFFKKHGHKNPNSTDVHATKKIKNMAAYLAKYMSKKNSFYEWDFKKKEEKITAASLVMQEHHFINFIKKVDREYDKKRKPSSVLTVMNYKAWYFQRLNFWNSPFNPRPISGRIWSCNYELSQANKCHVHIPNGDGLRGDLRCLMNPEIEYKSLYTLAPKELDPRYMPDDPRNMPRKIGEVYFLKAADWLNKINGVIRKTFDECRFSIQNLSTVTNFELDYG